MHDVYEMLMAVELHERRVPGARTEISGVEDGQGDRAFYYLVRISSLSNIPFSSILQAKIFMIFAFSIPVIPPPP